MLRGRRLLPFSLVVLLPLQLGCGSDLGKNPSDSGTGGALSDGAGGENTTPSGGAESGGATGGTEPGGPAPGGSNTGGEATGGSPNIPETPTAQEAAMLMGRGLNLGQMFESTQHPRTLAAAKSKIDAYYARGYRNVRIPITWTEPVGGDLLVDDAATGTVNRAHPRLEVISSIVDYALTKPGLFVVINTHHEARLKTESRSAVLEQLWKDISDIYRDRDHRLLFEILNEPHRADGTAMPAADLRQMVGLAYAQIRKVDPNRIVLFGGNQWFGAHEIPAVWTDLDPIGGGEDPYVMATFHHYDPWTFCGSDQGSYDDVWTDTNQSGPMDRMATWATTVGGGMPVYIGEWGVGWGSRYNTLTCNNVRQWYTTFDSVYAKKREQPTAVWDDGGWFMIFDHATGAFNNNLIDCIDGSCAWDGTERMNDGCL